MTNNDDDHDNNEYPPIVEPIIGRNNVLEIVSDTDFGVYLDGGDLGDILLPLKYLPKGKEIGDTIEVFISYDSEDRLIATTETPLAMVDEFAYLKVVDVNKHGAFLDWGLTKDLFVPFGEQTGGEAGRMKVDEKHIVFIYRDNTGRFSASAKLNKHMLKVDEDFPNYQPGEAVDLLIADKTDLGYKAIVDHSYWGVLYENEVFQTLQKGERVTGYIKKVREDGKIDLYLHQAGYAGVDEIAKQVFHVLEENGGYLKVTDKSDPEEIYKLFNVSKKKFKMAIGALYKKKLIVIEDEGIRVI